MKRYLILRDAKSEKFWQIETSETSFITIYGKVGTPGQTTRKEFENAEKCLKEAEKLVSSKLGKGYKETDVNADPAGVKGKEADYLNAWKTIANASEWKAALKENFAYLVDTPGYENYLLAMLENAKSVNCIDQQLIITFKSGEILRAYPPQAKVAAKYPESYRKLLSRHRILELEASRLKLGEHGDFESEWLEDADSELLEITNPKNIICPLWDYSDCWLYHPRDKNETGEPSIHFFSHEGGDIEEAQPCNAGSLFLRRACEILGLKVTPMESNKAQPLQNGMKVAWIEDKPIGQYLKAAARIENLPKCLIVYMANEKPFVSFLDLRSCLIEETKQIVEPKQEDGYFWDNASYDVIVYNRKIAVLTLNKELSKGYDLRRRFLIWLEENLRIETFSPDEELFFYDHFMVSSVNRATTRDFDTVEKNLETGEIRQAPRYIFWGNGEAFISVFQDEVVLYDATFKKLAKVKHKDIGDGPNVVYLPSDKLMVSMNSDYGNCKLIVADCSQKEPVLQKQTLPINVYEERHIFLLRGNVIWQLCMMTKTKQLSVMQLLVDRTASKVNFYPLEKFADNEDSYRLDETQCFQICDDQLFLVTKDGIIKTYSLST